MDTRMEMASEAAATAPKADVVPLRKETALLCLKSDDGASGLCVGGAQ
jgi:hypothetical protein